MTRGRANRNTHTHSDRQTDTRLQVQQPLASWKGVRKGEMQGKETCAHEEGRRAGTSGRSGECWSARAKIRGSTKPNSQEHTHKHTHTPTHQQADQHALTNAKPRRVMKKKRSKHGGGWPINTEKHIKHTTNGNQATGTGKRIGGCHDGCE